MQPPNPSWDLHFLPHPSLIDTFTIEQNTTNWVSVAHLPATAYASVDFSAVQTAFFDSMVQQTPAVAGDTFLIQTEQGRFFKLGNFAYDWWSYALYFDYEELLPPPPPARDEYLGIDSDWLDLDSGQIERGMWGAPSLIGWDVRIVPHPSLVDRFLIDHHGANWVQAGVLTQSYASVTYQDAINTPLTTAPLSNPFEAGNTAIIQTDQGRFFKLGNPYIDWYTWTCHFDYQELTP